MVLASSLFTDRHRQIAHKTPFPYSFRFYIVPGNFYKKLHYFPGCFRV